MLAALEGCSMELTSKLWIQQRRRQSPVQYYENCAVAHDAKKVKLPVFNLMKSFQWGCGTQRMYPQVLVVLAL